MVGMGGEGGGERKKVEIVGTNNQITTFGRDGVVHVAGSVDVESAKTLKPLNSSDKKTVNVAGGKIIVDGKVVARGEDKGPAVVEGGDLAEVAEIKTEEGYRPITNEEQLDIALGKAATIVADVEVETVDGEGKRVAERVPVDELLRLALETVESLDDEEVGVELAAGLNERLGVDRPAEYWREVLKGLRVDGVAQRVGQREGRYLLLRLAEGVGLPGGLKVKDLIRVFLELFSGIVKEGGDESFIQDKLSRLNDKLRPGIFEGLTRLVR